MWLLLFLPFFLLMLSFTFQEQKKNEENVQMFENLWLKTEAEVLVIIQDLIKKFGQPLTDKLKILLECSICKGLINSVYCCIIYYIINIHIKGS